MLKIKTCKKIKYGELTEGCKECILGRKSVLFITGKCHYQCFYCPISDDKRMKDIVKINEKIIKNPDTDEGLEEVIDEINKCSSWGVGITGGDPLLEIDRTIKYIKRLKKEFGDKFHIHLYTSLQCITKEKLEKLDKSGLDEIRFHIPIDNKKIWNDLLLGNNMQIKKGVEIPAIPGTKDTLKEMMDFIKTTNMEFININELEFSDISETSLTDKGFFVKDNLSYGIKDSEELAKWAVEYGKEIDIPTHYCSAKFKDDIQLRNRLLLRAQSVRKAYDDLDSEGLLIRGEITLTSEGVAEEFCIKEIFETIKEYYEIPEEMIEIENKRILIAGYILEEIWRDFTEHKEDFLFGNYIQAAIVKEYPTEDHFLIEKNPL